MNLLELSSNYPLLPDVFTIVRQVEEISGKEIDFYLCEDLYVDSLIIPARVKMPKHILRIRANQKKYLSETIAHECFHALRILSVPPGERFLSRSTPGNINDAKKELEYEISSLPPETKRMMLDTWINGLVLQVYNLPIDARIEQWIFNTYPGLRTEQREYLEKLAENCVSTFSKEREEITPPKVFRANMSMVFAFLKAIGILIGKEYDIHFNHYPEIIKYGLILYQYLQEPDRGYSMDIETTNEWARILGLTGWFSWTDFENVPQGYGE